MIKSKRVLVTGGGGSIGSELVRQLAVNNKVFILDNNETATFDLREELRAEGCWVHSRTGDIRNPATVEDVFSDFKPQVIFHAAAVKHVTPNEEYPQEAVEINILGTLNVLQAAKRWTSTEQFVFISTDKVVNANSIMGATKRVGEIMAKNMGYVAVRFGNVMGSRGSVIPMWQHQIDRGKPLTVTDKKMERFMMTIPEACQLVITAAETGKPGEILVMDMGEKINIYDMALSFKKKVKIIGIRPGETLSERLMTDEEERTAVKKGKFYIIK
jgi:FlaA1/EpsC-like NDP-sugar epimerase